MAELGPRLDEAKRVTKALQAEIVPAQMTALGEGPRACAACGRRLASKGHSAARFRSLFGDVPVRVRRVLVCPCQGASESAAQSVAVLDFGRGAAVAPELAYVTARYAAMAPFGKTADLLSELLRSAGRSTPARCAAGYCGSARRSCRRTPPRARANLCCRHLVPLSSA